MITGDLLRHLLEIFERISKPKANGVERLFRVERRDGFDYVVPVKMPHRDDTH